MPEPEGPTADEIEEYCNGVDADECSIDLVEQLREEASIMRKADPSGMQRWNEVLQLRRGVRGWHARPLGQSTWVL